MIRDSTCLTLGPSLDRDTHGTLRNWFVTTSISCWCQHLGLHYGRLVATPSPVFLDDEALYSADLLSSGKHTKGHKIIISTKIYRLKHMK